MSAAWFVLARITRDRSALLGLLLIAGLILSALLAPLLATHPDDVFELHPSERLRAPGAAHWLGTDRMGADVYSRLLFGARITILIGVIAVGASLFGASWGASLALARRRRRSSAEKTTLTSWQEQRASRRRRPVWHQRQQA